ncbi:MAG: signal transduction histidine kinase [Solidesulfovibrio magneticus str. Maddingley MBC34]|uniref:histidine kinase n=1 Tax=Solidesulfovibrio magneticus str. Maddingley MBC34 TaxID=1206767 RepID=K6H5E3_9BACT|nr:MAG: signal transduction histidine kinase [Solidesulfovibrio magneticus str. Maddingley MBC34]
MEQSRAKAPEAPVADVVAERDRLRLTLAEAGGIIERLRAEAQAGSQAKADFMARMTHEMRTPLSAIIGLSNLAKPLAAEAKLADYLAKIAQAARGLLEVVDDITDFSRLEKGQADLTIAPFKPAEALERAAGRIAEAAREKGLTLAVRLDPAVPAVLVGDSARLEAVLGHLAGNAVKFTERGGLRLEADLVDGDEETVQVAFAVTDTGIGMDQDAIPEMFDSFTQADGSLSRPYGGTGLGLALASRGVALLGGVLEVDSLPGRGTRFRFAVPFARTGEAGRERAAPAPPPAAPKPAARPQAAASPGMRPLSGTLVLLVEDNAINQQVARETLETLGAAVDVAINGREAVEMVRSSLYDVVLMDVQMPVMDGLAATRAIRQLSSTAELPIVALTAHALAEDRERCLEAGMNDYLTKPLEVDRLLASLGQWIAPAAAAVRGRDPALASLVVAAPADGAAVAAVPEGMDLAAARRRLGGNERLLASVAAEFVRDYAGAAAALEALIADGDLEAARRLAHTVKGVAGTLAALPLAEAARELETVLAVGGRPGPDALRAFARSLKAAVASAASLAPPKEPEPVCAFGSCWRVLLVDDAKLNRAIFSQILRSGGHEVVTAENGKEACRRLFGEKPDGRPFDLILMDIEMPEMDGPTAARTIRRLLGASVSPPCAPGVPIVALTSHDCKNEQARCQDAGMDACLHKVFEQGELLAILQGLMDGREPAGQPIRTPHPAGANPAGLAPALKRLAGHLAEGNIRADEDMAVVREAFIGRVAPPQLAELGEAVDRYDFTAAAVILDRLVEVLGLRLQV